MAKGQLLLSGMLLIVAFIFIDIALAYNFSDNERLALFLMSIVSAVAGMGVYVKGSQ
jgi:ascorbate-specific PTS system EIIC-type component UlaA